MFCLYLSYSGYYDCIFKSLIVCMGKQQNKTPNPKLFPQLFPIVSVSAKIIVFETVIFPVCEIVLETVIFPQW